jgi:hypothetical protein
MVSTENPYSDPLLHIIAIKGYSEIVISINMHTMNSISSARQVGRLHRGSALQPKVGMRIEA